MTTADDYAELEAWLAGDDDLPRSQSPSEAPILVEGLDDASRQLRRLARLARQEGDVKAIAQAEIDRIKAWLDDRRTGIERRRAWLTQGLESFTRAYAEANSVKSVSLPNGTLRLRKAPIVVADPDPDADLRHLAATHPRLVRITYALDKNVAKEDLTPGYVLSSMPDGRERHVALDRDGEVVPGVFFLVDPTPRFTLTTAEELTQ